MYKSVQQTIAFYCEYIGAPFYKYLVHTWFAMASDCPQSTIPPPVLVTPDLVIYNRSNSSLAMQELTCPLDSSENLRSARERKQGKKEYLEIQSEFIFYFI